MPRLKLDLPKTFHFQTQMSIRVTDLNYGGHLGNDALVGMLHEARARFLKKYGCNDIETIMLDLVVVYKAEGFLGDKLQFDLTAGEFTQTSCDVLFRVTRASDGGLIATAKTGIAFFDYRAKKPRAVPVEFRNKFEPEELAVSMPC